MPTEVSELPGIEKKESCKMEFIRNLLYWARRGVAVMAGAFAFVVGTSAVAYAQTTTTIDPKAVVTEQGGIALVALIGMLVVCIGFGITWAIMKFGGKKVIKVAGGGSAV